MAGCGLAGLLLAAGLSLSPYNALAGESDGGVHFHGYGELHYSNTDKPEENDKMDFHRMVIGLNYSFNDWISFDTEVDFEHAATEMELEFAHVSFRIAPVFNLRIGSMLMPMGYLNEFHEPPLFFSVERPYVQKYVIPTTWQEGGIGIFGAPRPDINYRLYLVGGLDAASFHNEFGIRSGRGKVAGSKADDLAGVGRLEFGGVPGLKLGISGYYGNAAQGDSDLGDATVNIFEGDLRFQLGDLELTGLYAMVNIGDTDKIKAATDEVVGEQILGWYIEGAYHLGELLMPGKEGDLVLFARHEEFNTQETVASGFEASPANDRKVTTFGLSHYFIPPVAVKADYEMWEDASGENWNQFNFGLGLMY